LARRSKRNCHQLKTDALALPPMPVEQSREVMFISPRDFRESDVPCNRHVNARCFANSFSHNSDLQLNATFSTPV